MANWLPMHTRGPSPNGKYAPRGKRFAYYWVNHHDDGRIAIWCKSTALEQPMFESVDVDRVAMPANRTRGVRNDSRPRGYLTRQACTRVLGRALEHQEAVAARLLQEGGDTALLSFNVGPAIRACIH